MYHSRPYTANETSLLAPLTPSSSSSSTGSRSFTFSPTVLPSMSSPVSSFSNNVAQRSSTWQDRLQEHCQARRIPAPKYNVLSDRRGKRTAWSCTVSVSGDTIPAKYWYDGQYVNTAKEDAAEAALQRLQGKTNLGGGASSLQGRIVEWGR